MQAANTNQPYNLKGVRVLVVEDFPFMAQLMSSMLKEFNVGHIISTCEIREARQLIEQYNLKGDIMNYIDMVITDLFPPRDEGLELLRWIRSHEEETICYIPILFCTAHTTRRVVESGRDLGTNEIMVKPVSAEKLAHRILHIIDNPRPYVKAPHYFGPDRRRKTTFIDFAERRKNEDNIKVINE
ncbi:MAG: response regulator [Alphaproteobacteria bacterium]